MNSSLLATKLRIPPARPDLLARPRLIARLNEGLTRPLTLISAPPGFGKTTLLTAWLEHQPWPAAWYSLDEQDNDLARFLAYLAGALESIHVEVGWPALNRIRSRRRQTVEALMTRLSNDLAVIPRDFILVLDDYHLIESQEIHEALAFLLEHLPPPLHLVIASRADPSFPLTRMRARGQLVELRASDLRFSPEEAALFLNQRMGLGLTPEQVAALDERAEGWIAGLQMAALSLQGHEDVAGFVRAFAGSHGFILDYLVEEVLQRQTPQVQTFLLETGILDQMNAALADVVTERDDGAEILAQLDKANLFLVPLDDTRQWYRYHHLFEDLLRSRLHQTRPDQIPELHRRASAWYEQNGFPNEAISHALAMRDFDRAAILIEQAALPLILHSETVTLLDWVAQLPEAPVRQRPLLSLAYAAALINIGKIELGSARLALVDETQLDPQYRVFAGLLRSTLAMLVADSTQAIESARTALEQSETSIANLAAPPDEFTVVAALFVASVLIELQINAGKLQDAGAICRRSLELGEYIAPGSPWGLALGFIHYELAELLYEWNDLGPAERHATRGLEICREGRNEELESYALMALARVKQAQGDTASAYDLVQQTLRLARKRHIAGEMRYLSARLIQVLIAQGRVDLAAQVVNELPPADETTLSIERGLGFVARARVLLAQHEFAAAADLLERLEGEAQTNGQTGTLIEIVALLALAHHGQGDTALATAAMRRALSLAQPEGYVRMFVDLATKSMISDLADLNGVEAPDQDLERYADKILAAFPAPSSQLKSPIPEPLTEREVMVLGLIASGLSNQEIADRLVVAVSTVKTHINNIYGKLGAGTRTQALARARELGLLS